MDWNNEQEVLQYMIKCSTEGGVLTKGIKVYHGGRPVAECNQNVPTNPKEYVRKVCALKETAGTFIHSWKYNVQATEEDKDLVKNANGFACGICCGILGGQKGGMEQVITMPELTALKEVKMDGNDIVRFYGDKEKLEDCTHVAMHLCQMGTSAAKEEFVFLTPVPEEWVSELKQ